ncbi:MAG: glycosyltransferase family 4 protein [Proteobacteria bacterium]|nr:glycosyltransferase family 4 protein [Pseudomonadota bacterium]MBU4294845.1 glycosyltransferase family 4 protein [Pseudomonadota bacterium]MCG2749347.1 glycosyltransferase family 4 protein [Desulfobulbaceae bacterium]
MKLAICLFNYFPYGGLERNFLRISRECLARGHTVDVFTMRWEGEKPDGISVSEIAPRGMSNHRQAAAYTADVAEKINGKNFDLVLGFNRMPGLDLYYAADVCYVARIARQRSFLARLTPRYRIFAAFERAVFAPESTAHIIMLSEQEKDIYQTIYGTPENRFHIVPPGVDKERIRSCLNGQNREKVRAQLGLSPQDNFLLMIGSHFHTKGVDRSIHALAALPPALKNATYLFIIGKGKENPYLRLAQKLGITDHVHFLGTREDVPLFLVGADFVLQPSRTENTGNAIVEALVAGVPVMATDTCGYAVHVERAGAGRIIPCSPFSQENMNAMLREMLSSGERKIWQQQALAYADATDLYNRFKFIADCIEATAAQKSKRGQGA